MVGDMIVDASLKNKINNVETILGSNYISYAAGSKLSEALSVSFQNNHYDIVSLLISSGAVFTSFGPPANSQQMFNLLDQLLARPPYLSSDKKGNVVR